MTTIVSAALALALALALAMIAAVILAIGGMKLVRKDRQRGLLMMAAAIVLVGNVLVWTV